MVLILIHFRKIGSDRKRTRQRTKRILIMKARIPSLLRILSCVGLFLLGSLSILYGQNSWSVKFKGIGIFSSPRVTDLNGDGIGDIVFGAGRTEFHNCDSA